MLTNTPAEMESVITLSSDSDSDSEVEFVGFFSNRNVTFPLSWVRVEVDALHVQTVQTQPNNNYIKPRWNSEMLDLTGYDNKVCDGYTKSSSHDRTEDSRLISHLTTSVELKRLSILENNLGKLLTSYRVRVTGTGETMSLDLEQCDCNGTQELLNTIHSCQPSIESPQDHCSKVDHFLQEHEISQPSLPKNTNNFLSVPSPTCASAPSKEHNGLSDELCAYSPSLPIETLTVQPTFSNSSSSSPVSFSISYSDDVTSLTKSIPIYEDMGMTGLLEHGEMPFDSALSLSSPPPVAQTIDSELSFTYDIGVNSPASFSWEDIGRDKGENDELDLDLDCTHRPAEDDNYVCPAALKIGMQAHKTFLADAESHAVMLCHRSLSMVYSCIEVSYPEGTLQLLSDLLKPGYYPPKEITLHLLKDILLNPQCPHHYCRKAFSLLIQTQRNKFVDKESVSWNWEMLNDVMENKELRPEIVCMFLNYVAQTLEDDFNTKKSTSALYESIVKVMLSFDKQFPQIRDVCKWLFSVIGKSTDDNHSKEDHISFSRMVVRFQKMLSLALEVDSSPAISSAKLSQELFHMLISNAPLRPQRMLLLDSLQSKRLRCKLLEHLLDYSCPVKTSVPMSLSLLLHFLKNCTLSPDPNDGTDKWRRWEELLCHLWTLLLSYSNAMKDYLSSSLEEQRHTTGTWIYKPEDVLTICAVREAVEAFMSRSQDDIGEALPLHVEESLTYLQDYLIDICQH